jgi:hypothetical protein
VRSCPSSPNSKHDQAASEARDVQAERPGGARSRLTQTTFTRRSGVDLPITRPAVRTANDLQGPPYRGLCIWPSRYRTLPAFARRQVAAGPSARFRSCLSAAKARWSHTRIFGHSYPIRAGPLLMTASHRGQQNSPPDLPSERSDTPHAFLRRPTRALTSRPAASRYIGHTFAASTITTAAPVSGLFTKHRRRFW